MMHSVCPYRLTVAWIVLTAIVLAGIWPKTALGQVSAEQSARQLKPAAGLEATMWASEPLLANPTNIDVDSRGRVWVAEGLNYRLTRGGNRRFGRIDQADRIKILEDTDGDGKADKMTVFADQIFPVPMGIAVEEHHDDAGTYQGCRVYVGNSPDLLVLEDTDGDDKADKRYPLLTGFGGIDSDHGVHGMVLGIDGKLYFTHGDGCCSVQHDHSERAQNFDVVDKSGRHVWTDQLANTMRVNRDGTQFEIICDRQRNNYETSLNSFGNIFTSDNDDDGHRGCRVIWAMDGGHYGYRTLNSPRHWGEEVPGNVPKIVGTGNGSPCGITVYEGELLPAEYRGGVLEVDAGTRQVNFFPLSRKGAAFQAEYKVFLAGDDPWFRPVDACTAPDGSVFVADWYDAGVGGHAFSDQTTGRIYRIAPHRHNSQKVTVDFATPSGLLAAARSPNIATQDAARRGLIARGNNPDVRSELANLAIHGTDPIYRARALWIWSAIEGDGAAVAALSEAANRGDARIRELAVRMLGRDCRENGHVEYENARAKRPPAALAHLNVLLPLVSDPDAGVRRELILALRRLPTDLVGNALRKLATAWDGQDRWYLEALGLALESRESDYLSKLFDGTLYGTIDLSREGTNGNIALPPYFPVDRNEAFIAIGSPELPSSSLSKNLGMAWRIHRREVLPILARLIPQLHTAQMQQTVDDILERMDEPATADLVADIATQTPDRGRKQQLMTMLARRLSGEWNAARARPKVVRIIEQTLSKLDTRLQGIALAASTGDSRYRARFEELSQDATASEDVRVAAAEALAVDAEASTHVLEQLIASVRGRSSSNPVAEAAVRAVAHLHDARDRMTTILTTHDFPLGLRREALRTLSQLQNGNIHLFSLAETGKLANDLKTDATTLLQTSPDRRIRERAASILPLPKTAAGQSLPPIAELIRQNGDAVRGRAVFFRAGTNSCSNCHRVQGRGRWIGPDLSTIGVKSARDELIRSILSPSAAIGYSYRSLVLSLADGRVITGLPIEESANRLVVKTADGQRISLDPHNVEDRQTSDVSLMPEGLVGIMTTQELVDLLAYLASLRQPVSIVGQYHLLGPLNEPNDVRRVDPTFNLDFRAPVSDDQGRVLQWRRLSSNAEGQADLTPLVLGDATCVFYVAIPTVSPARQQARLVLDSPAESAVWLNGTAVTLSPRDSSKQEPQVAMVDLAKGTSSLLIRMAFKAGSKTQVSLVTTFVADEPISFDTGESR